MSLPRVRAYSVVPSCARQSASLLERTFSRFGAVSDPHSRACIAEMAKACHGRPLMVQALISLLTKDVVPGASFSLPTAWARVSQFVNFERLCLLLFFMPLLCCPLLCS